MANIASPLDVVVVGAGLSGLRAAVDIHNAGLSVAVLEARDRVGGKTLSTEASHLGGKIDLGAAWINDTNQSEMYKLAREFEFELIEQRATGFNLAKDLEGNLVKVPHGSQMEFPPEIGAAVQTFLEELMKLVATAHPVWPHLSPDAQHLDSITFAEFARTVSQSDFGVMAANYLLKSLLGVEAEEVSALFVIDYLQSGTGLQNMASDGKDGAQYLRNRQGNQAFSTRLAAKLPSGSVRLNTAVSKIVQTSPDACEVVTQDGTILHAKTVIVSIPTCQLPDLTFEPPLPPAKQALSKSTALGYYSKSIFVFDSPWWREAGLSGVIEPNDGPISFSRDTCVEQDGQYSITCFIVGDSGRRWSKWSATERQRLITEQFDSYFGEAARAAGVKVPAPINVLEKEWSKDPWSLGAPSPVTLPGTLTDGTGYTIREPWKNVHFVGTETATVWKGYMEGAVRSGIRGAHEVIEKLKKQV